MAFFSKGNSTTASPYKAIIKSPCRVRITYKAIHTIIGDDTNIDFRFFKDIFGISLSKEPDRNPVVLKIDIKNEKEIHISKKNLTTPIQIRYSEEESWKSFLLGDSAALETLIFMKVGVHETKLEKVTVQANGTKLSWPSPKQTGKVSISKSSNSALRDIDDEPRIKSSYTIEDSPIQSTKKVVMKNKEKKEASKKSANAFEYFDSIINTPSKSFVMRQAEMISSSSDNKKLKKGSPFEVEEISQNDYCNTNDTNINDKAKSVIDVETLLEKRNGSQDLLLVEEEMRLEGKISKKKLKLEKFSKKIAEPIDIENIEDSDDVKTIQMSPEKSHTESENFKDLIESEDRINQILRKKKKVIRILDDDDEEEKDGIISEVSKGIKEKRDDNFSVSDNGKMIEEEKTELRSPDTLRDSEECFLNNSSKSSSPKQNKNQIEQEKNKLKRLKKIVDNRRETLNKQDVEKSLQKSHEQKEGKIETCPICLNEITKEVAKIDSCTHMFCFDCIKDWADVTNECPYCKRRFHEINKYSIGEGGSLTKLDSTKVKFKKQVYEEEVNYIEEETDENCYECGTNEDQNVLLLCDDCGFHCCHTYCCDPPFEMIPEGDWFCKFCTRRSQRNSRGRRNANTNQREREVQNPPRRLTRNSSRRGQSLLERLFEMAGDEAILANDPIYNEDQNYESADSIEDIEEVELPRRTSSRNSRSNRRLTTLQNNSRNEPSEYPRQTRRNTRASGIGMVEEDFNSNLDDYQYSNTRSTRTRNQGNRMNIENVGRSTDNNMNLEDLNQFRYPLRSYGRSNS